MGFVDMAARAICSAAFLGLLCGATKAEDAAAAVSVEAVGGFDTLVDKAQAEGELLVYGGPGAGKMIEWFADFEALYGIRVEYYRASSNIVFQRFMREQATGRQISDILINSVRENLILADEAGYLAEYVPQSAAMFAPETVLPGKAWPAYLTIQSVAWNTRLVPEDLQAQLRAEPLEALLDPRFKGRLALVRVNSGELPLAANANIAINQAETYGWPYLEALAEQDPFIVETGASAMAAVVAGDAWATPDAADSIFGPAAVSGAPIAFSFPQITAATEFQMAIPRNARHPYAARLLMEWMTSPEAQAKLAELSQAAVVIEGWTDTREISAMDWYRPPQQLWFGFRDGPQLRDEARTAFYDEWHRLFDR